jgi:hypothetical protein
MENEAGKTVAVHYEGSLETEKFLILPPKKTKSNSN